MKNIWFFFIHTNTGHFHSGRKSRRKIRCSKQSKKKEPGILKPEPSYWKNPVWFIRKGESQTEVSFYLHDTPIVFPLEEHPMYWVNSAESSVFLFSQGRKDEEPWLPSWKCRKKSQQEDSPMYTIWPVCVLLKSPEEESPQAINHKQDENWKCPFRRESQWKGYWLEDLEIVSNKRKGWVQSSSSISPTLVGSEKETFRKENRKRNPTFSRRILPQEDTSDDLGSWRVLVRQLPQEKPNIPFRFYQPLISNFAEETPMYK